MVCKHYQEKYGIVDLGTRYPSTPLKKLSKTVYCLSLSMKFINVHNAQKGSTEGSFLEVLQSP